MINPFYGNSLFSYNPAKHLRFEICTDIKERVNKFRWRIYMSSDIVAASTQGYATRTLWLENVKAVGRHVAELEKEGKRSGSMLPKNH